MHLVFRFLNVLISPVRSLFYWCGRLVPGLKKIPRFSVPLRCALLVFFAALVFTIVYIIKVNVDENTQHMIEGFWGWTGLAGLLIAIPVATYFAVKLFLQGEVSKFPDIDRDWKAGLEALAQHGIAVGDTPLFLVIGNADHQVSEQICRASKIAMNVTQTPNGPGSLHWYANQESIFLFLTNACCTSKLASLSISSPSQAVQPGQTPAAAAARGTIVAGADGGFEPAAGQTGGAPPRMASPAAMQTMKVDPTKSISAPLQELPVAAHQDVQVVLPPNDANDQEARLEHVCNLIRKNRYPVCPINGVLSLMPFRLIETSSDQVQLAVQRDVKTFRDQLKLRCPVTVMVNEMENEPGFRELVRRVGIERAQMQRFGKGNHVWNPPTNDRLDAVGRQACGAFEDWTYMLFREHDGLRKPGNTKLFALLCKIRGTFTESLAGILDNGFGYDAQTERSEGEEQLLFSGCYFAATGSTEDRQAFVHGVIKKMIDQEGDLSWAPGAWRENEGYKLIANLLGLLALLSILALLFMIADEAGWLAFLQAGE